MAIVRCLSKPDMFVTFTCNPNWPEIIKNLPTGQVPSDRPDLCVRVFNIKLKALLYDLYENDILGKVNGRVHVIVISKKRITTCTYSTNIS
jgi:hypothetical protein